MFLRNNFIILQRKAFLPIPEVQTMFMKCDNLNRFKKSKCQKFCLSSALSSAKIWSLFCTFYSSCEILFDSTLLISNAIIVQKITI